MATRQLGAPLTPRCTRSTPGETTGSGSNSLQSAALSLLKLLRETERSCQSLKTTREHEHATERRLTNPEELSFRLPAGSSRAEPLARRLTAANERADRSGDSYLERLLFLARAVRVPQQNGAAVVMTTHRCGCAVRNSKRSGLGGDAHFRCLQMRRFS